MLPRTPKNLTRKSAPVVTLDTVARTRAPCTMIAPMELSLFGFIIRYSKREQLLIVPLVIAANLIYFSMLDLPKAIINEAIQGKRVPVAEATAAFLRVHFTLPA